MSNFITTGVIKLIEGVGRLTRHLRMSSGNTLMIGSTLPTDGTMGVILDNTANRTSITGYPGRNTTYVQELCHDIQPAIDYAIDSITIEFTTNGTPAIKQYAVDIYQQSSLIGAKGIGDLDIADPVFSLVASSNDVAGPAPATWPAVSQVAFTFASTYTLRSGSIYAIAVRLATGEALDAANYVRVVVDATLPITEGGRMASIDDSGLSSSTNNEYAYSMILGGISDRNDLQIVNSGTPKMEISSTVGATRKTMRLSYHAGDNKGLIETYDYDTAAAIPLDIECSAFKVNGSEALPDANIPNLDASKITAGTFDAARIPSLDASKITTGAFDTARIPSLDAAKIASGILDAARIPDLDAAKIISGVFDAARIPNLDASKITTGTIDGARLPSGLTLFTYGNYTGNDTNGRDITTTGIDPKLVIIIGEYHTDADYSGVWIAIPDANVRFTPAVEVGASGSWITLDTEKFTLSWADDNMDPNDTGLSYYYFVLGD